VSSLFWKRRGLTRLPTVEPRARSLPVTFDTVRLLGDQFKMSLTSTAIRLVENGGLPSMLICNSPRNKEWFVASLEVKGRPRFRRIRGRHTCPAIGLKNGLGLII
jgi:hypothetical protein